LPSFGADWMLGVTLMTEDTFGGMPIDLFFDLAELMHTIGWWDMTPLARLQWIADQIADPATFGGDQELQKRMISALKAALDEFERRLNKGGA